MLFWAQITAELKTAFADLRVLPGRERLLPQPRLHPVVQEPGLFRGHPPPAADPPGVLQLQHLQPDQPKVRRQPANQHD